MSAHVAVVELVRACLLKDEQAVPMAREFLSGIDLIPLSDAVVEAAATAQPKMLRTLDAVHLASAMSIAPDITAFVVYDRKLAEAGAGAGFEVIAPR